MRHLPELLLLRHGETEWNREGRFQGSADSVLTPRGREQAASLGRLLAGQGAGPGTHDAFASPQPRALETAWIALSPLGLEAVPDPRLAEIGMGCWTGLRRAEIAARWPGPEEEPVLAFYARCPDGERLGDVAARARGVLNELRRPSVVVTHGITLRLLCAMALGGTVEDAEGIRVPQGCLVRIARGRMEVIGSKGLPDPTAAASPEARGG